MHAKLRMIIFVVTSVVAAGTVVWMQRRFESGDEHNALTVVQTYRSGSNVALPELISYRHPGRTPVWSTKTQSACFQHIVVSAAVSDIAGRDPTVYSFAVDINGPTIHPANANGTEILQLLDNPPPDLRTVLARPGATASASAGASATTSSSTVTSASPEASATTPAPTSASSATPTAEPL